jgi:hypothetical protein
MILVLFISQQQPAARKRYKSVEWKEKKYFER